MIDESSSSLLFIYVFLHISASVTAITLLLGSFIAPPIMGKLGRRVAHFVVIANILVGWTVILLSKSFTVSVVILTNTTVVSDMRF